MREDLSAERRRSDAERRRSDAERRTSRGSRELEDLRSNPAFQDQGRGLIQPGPKLDLKQINQGN
jgi:hypothetical protein